MLSFCEKHHILTDDQFGFTKGRSTEQALLTQKEFILNAFEQKLLTLGVFIDFSKAFDRINHETLIGKLETYGFRGVFLSTIKSYLEYRCQVVVIENHTSDLKLVTSGVPQGSILGPLLFNAYINDITNITSAAKYIIYADDTTLLFRSASCSELVTCANSALNKLNTWCQVNSLTINTNKTKAILFQPKNSRANITDRIFIGNSTVDVTSSVKCLGVIFDEHLTWNKHVDSLSGKLAGVVGALAKVRSFLPTSVKLLVYNSLFFSHLKYCHLVWGNTTQSNITKLSLLQKKAVRAISNSAYDAHTEPLFKKLQVCPVNLLLNELLLQRYLTERKQGSHFIEHLSSLRKNIKKYNTRHNATWFIPRARTNYGTQLLSHSLPSLLNSLGF